MTPIARLFDSYAKMWWWATGLVVAMMALYALARIEGGAHPVPAWGYVRAFAEAAMVGSLADWFAVTALFRHPLGLPIWHTAIIPRNKDRIGIKLASFLRGNFLTADLIARRVNHANVAGIIGRWLDDPAAGGSSRLLGDVARVFATILESLDQERLGAMVRAGLAQRLRDLNLSPLLGNTLAAAIAENRHVPLMDSIIVWAGKVLSTNEEIVREMVRKQAGSLLRWTGLDETIATKVIGGLDKMLTDMADDPDHPLRAKAEEGLATLAYDLVHSPSLQARVQAIKAELVDNPALGDWWQGVWESARAGMLRMARDADAVVSGPFGEVLKQLGTKLRDDPALAATINGFARDAAIHVADNYADVIERFVVDTVRGWDAETVTEQIEQAVGRDLQYIRVNGTLVGGLVGLALHVVDVWA